MCKFDYIASLFLSASFLPSYTTLYVQSFLHTHKDVYFSFTLQDSQCSNWEQRPLSPEQIEYAAADTQCLLAIFDTLLSKAVTTMSLSTASAVAGQRLFLRNMDFKVLCCNLNTINC